MNVLIIDGLVWAYHKTCEVKYIATSCCLKVDLNRTN